jgi:type IV fimbrial biogenesis protein FimT
MLSAPRGSRGMTLIEIVIGLAIMAFLMLLAAPEFSAWVTNARVRTTAESVLNGLQYARSEAVARNARVRFQFTTTLDSTCALSTTGRNWVVNLDPDANPDEVVGQCNAAPSDAAAPFILQRRSAVEGSGSTATTATASSLVFNGLGRITPVPAGNITVNLSNPDAGECAAVGGPVNCLRIVIAPGGQVRMCNPKFAAGDPQAC